MTEDRITSRMDSVYLKVQERLKAEGKDYSLDVIEKIFRSQFHFVRKVINDGDWYSVRLKYLGIFGVKTKRVKFSNSGEQIREELKDKQPGEEAIVRTPSGKDISIQIW